MVLLPLDCGIQTSSALPPPRPGAKTCTPFIATPPVASVTRVWFRQPDSSILPAFAVLRLLTRVVDDPATVTPFSLNASPYPLATRHASVVDAEKVPPTRHPPVVGPFCVVPSFW